MYITKMKDPMSFWSTILRAASSRLNPGNSRVVHWLRLHTPNAGWGTRCHLLQLKILMPQLTITHVATKTQSSQINFTYGKIKRKSQLFSLAIAWFSLVLWLLQDIPMITCGNVARKTPWSKHPEGSRGETDNKTKRNIKSRGTMW